MKVPSLELKLVENLLVQLGPAAVSHDDTNVTNGQTYYYAVSAVYEVNATVEESDLSNEASARPLAAPATIDPSWYKATVQETRLIPPISATMAGIMVATSRLSAACNQIPKQTSDSDKAY